MDEATTPAPPMPPLGAAFPAPSLDRWRALVDGVLDRSGTADRADLDRRFERRLVSTTHDGIRLQPLYTPADARAEAGLPGHAPFVRGRTAAGHVVAGWEVRQPVATDSVADAADLVLAELEGGATSVLVRTGPGGLPAEALAQALAGVHLDLAAVALEPWSAEAMIAGADALVAVWRERLDDASAASGSLGLDPLGHQARTGVRDDALVAAAIERALGIADLPRVTALVADGRPVHEAGGTDADELGWVLAVAAEYLRHLMVAGASLDQAAAAIELRLTATADQFATIAKLRAARRGWARVLEVAGDAAAARRTPVTAITSWAMTSRRDPWVNLLRTTVAAFAAGTGGADAVTVLPFDAALGRSDAFARRLARNIQALLLEESNLARVIDPAGGSWFVESFTDELAHAAWAWVRDLEAAGGAQAALDEGLVDERCAAARGERFDAIAHRRDPLTGVSEFPDVHEEPVVRPADAEPPAGGLPRIRYAQPFEALRDRADAAAAAGAAPSVVLVLIGTPADTTARATFAKNLFEAGGLRTVTVDADDAASVAGLADATVCLCSSDAVYAERAAAVAAAVRTAGASRVLLAGAPGATAEALRAAGVDEFVHVGIDVLDVLERTALHLGVQP
jgi:methylmalonyl-CoA mutase